MNNPFLIGNPLFADREAIRKEIGRLGLDISLEPEIREALRPAKIAGRAVGNRFVIHPMEGCDGTLDGKPSEVTYHRWGRFARGGAKMLWGEAMAVAPEARANTRQLLLIPQTAPELARLIEFARKEHERECGSADDFLVGVQLTHSGRYSFPVPSILFHDRRADATTTVGKERRPLPPGYPLITDERLDRLQDTYVAAAKLVRDAGADFVDIKQCHCYLLSEMLAARTRKGRYGGSLENRTRFASEVLRRIRSEMGGDLILATRMNVYDGIPYVKNPDTGMGEPAPIESPYRVGFGVDPERPVEPDLKEPIEAIRRYCEAGLQLLNVTAGNPYFNFHVGRPADTPPPDGFGLPESGLVGVARHFLLTSEIQRAFPDLPVVGTGYSYLRQFAAEAGEANIRAGQAGFVGLGRGAIAYPDFVRDIIKTGRMDRGKVCITVSYCTSLMRAKGNELGQVAAGCVPRDPLYAKLYQEVRKKERGA